MVRMAKPGVGWAASGSKVVGYGGRGPLLTVSLVVCTGIGSTACTWSGRGRMSHPTIAAALTRRSAPTTNAYAHELVSALATAAGVGCRGRTLLKRAAATAVRIASPNDPPIC